MWQCGNITVNHRSRVFVTKYVARLHLFFFSPLLWEVLNLWSVILLSYLLLPFFENVLGKSKTRKQSLLKNFKVKKVIFRCSQMMITTDNSSTLVLPFYKAPLYDGNVVLNSKLQLVVALQGCIHYWTVLGFCLPLSQVLHLDSKLCPSLLHSSLHT